MDNLHEPQPDSMTDNSKRVNIPWHSNLVDELDAICGC